MSALRTSQGLARFRKSLPPDDVSVCLSKMRRMSRQFPGSFHFRLGIDAHMRGGGEGGKEV